MSGNRQKKCDFLRTLEDGCTLEAAAEQCGINRTTAFRWRKQDPGFDAEVRRLLAAQAAQEIWGPPFNRHRPPAQDIVYPKADVEEDARAAGYVLPRGPVVSEKQPLLVMPRGATITPVRDEEAMLRHRRVVAFETSRRRRREPTENEKLYVDPLRYGLK